jgi:hypothetical protein
MKLQLFLLKKWTQHTLPHSSSPEKGAKEAFTMSIYQAGRQAGDASRAMVTQIRSVVEKSRWLHRKIARQAPQSLSSYYMHKMILFFGAKKMSEFFFS